MSLISPLNPELYGRLIDYYGDVAVVNAGAAINWRTVWQRRPGRDGVFPRREVLAAGEEYQVRCRLCRDHRARLWINHRWGVWDPETNSRNLWLAHCFNEQCYSDFESREILYGVIYAVGRRSRTSVTVLPGRPSSPAVLRPLPLPGPLTRLDVLAGQQPSHPAIEYLAGVRGFDPIKLGRLWGIAYCPRSHFYHASHRIIIPIYDQQMCVGWQARFIGDDIDGVPFNKAGVPKYWTSPGFPRRLSAYNLERALQHPTVVVVEGPADAWNTGLMATAVLGKTMSTPVQLRLIAGMQKHGSDAVVVVALDPKPDTRDALRHKPHPIERLCAQLSPDLGKRVVPVYLPGEYDPGSIDPAWLREIIREQASQQGLHVSFQQPR